MNLAQLSSAIRTEPAGPTLLELCAACEQVTSDLHFHVGRDERPALERTARRWLSLASLLAYHLFYERDPHALEAVVTSIGREAQEQEELADSMRETSEAYANIPECFARDLLDLTQYAGFVRAHLAERPPAFAVVVGLRTSGSYLAPVWHAALTSLGAKSAVMTSRPLPQPAREREEAPAARVGIAAPLEASSLSTEELRAASGFVLDDIAFTGDSYLHVERYLTSLGLRARNVAFSQNTPLVLGSLRPAPRRALSSRPVVVPPRTPDGVADCDERAVAFFAQRLEPDVDVESVQLAGPTFMQRHLAAHSTAPTSVFVRFDPRGRDRHYVVAGSAAGRPVRLFAKVAGVGTFARAEYRRIAQFEPAGYRPVALRGGFIFYEWIDGTPLGPEAPSVSSDDLESVAEYACLLQRLNAVGRLSSAAYSADVVHRLEAVAGDTDLTRPIQPLLESLAVATAGVSLVAAPRNQGLWHHIRTGDGRLRRVHLDLGEWSRKIDVAEELAAAIFELDLSEQQGSHLLSAFVANGGDPHAARRLRLGALSYAASVLDNYRYWDEQIARIPARFRRPETDPGVRRQRAREQRAAASLAAALRGDPPFSES